MYFGFKREMLSDQFYERFLFKILNVIIMIHEDHFDAGINQNGGKNEQDPVKMMNDICARKNHNPA